MALRATVLLLALLSAPLFMTAPAAADSPPTWVRDFGTYGSGPGATSGDAMYVATDPFGNVYVTDRGFGTVKKYSGTGTFLLSWGGPGTGQGQFGSPFGIAAGTDGLIYVTDAIYNHVQVFTSSGAFVRWWGTTGSGNGQFSGPQGIAVSPAGVVYVSDTANNRIQMFQTDGTYLGQWGGLGSGNGQLNSPTGICVAPNGNVLVADHYNYRIQRFTSGGGWLGGFGQVGYGPGDFLNIWDIDTDAAGNVWVTDVSPIVRVQKFTPTGTRLTLLGTDTYALQGCGPNYLYTPFGVAVYDQSIYIVDSNGCFRVAQYLDSQVTATAPTSWGRLKMIYRW